MISTRRRKRFFTALEADGEWTHLFSFIPEVSFFMKDKDGYFMALNQLACHYCGISTQEEAYGRTDFDFFPSQRAEAYRAVDLIVMNSDQAIVNRIEAAPEQMRSPRLVVTNKIPLHGKGGRVIGIAGITRPMDRVANAMATDVQRFAEIVQLIHQHYAEELTTPQFARMANMSVSKFERSFREAFGISPHKYVLRIRTDAAAKQLVTTRDTISAIAQDCGFHDHAHFSRTFSRLMTVSPTAYRRRHQFTGGTDTK